MVVLPLPAATLVALAGVSAAVFVLIAPGVPGCLASWPVATSLWQISVTPFCRATGIYRYHSPMLKATVPTSRTYEVHGGTSWDWLGLFRFRDRGSRAARQVTSSRISARRSSGRRSRLLLARLHTVFKSHS